MKNPIYERWRYMIFGVTWLAYAGLYLTRKSFSVVKVAVGPGTALGFSKGQMAAIDTGYSAAYALGQFVFGVVGDRLGTRRVVLAGLLGSVLVAFAMGLSSTVWAFAALFALQGICQSTGWAPLAKNVGQFFSRRERGTVMGLWCTNYAVGGFVATLFAGFVAGQFGWRAAFLVPASVLFAIAGIFFWFQRDRPEDVGLPPVDVYHGEVEKAPRNMAAGPSNDRRPGEVLAVLRSPMVLLLCFVYFLLKPVRYLFLFWGPQFIHESLDTGMAMSAFVAATFELGGPLGAMLGGYGSDRVFGARRVPVAACSLIALSLLLYLLHALPRMQLAFAAALFVIGAFVYAADSLLAGTAAVDFGTKDGAGTSTGLINGAGSLGQILGPAIPGVVPESWGWHGIFSLLAVTVLFAGVILLPKWNALPAERR